MDCALNVASCLIEKAFIVKSAKKNIQLIKEKLENYVDSLEYVRNAVKINLQAKKRYVQNV